MSTPIPTLTPVGRSSTIDAVGYRAETEELTIRFHGGATYSYRNITTGLYKSLLAAPSIGGYFAKYIKSDPVRFPCTKLTGLSQAPKQSCGGAYFSLVDLACVDCGKLTGFRTINGGQPICKACQDARDEFSLDNPMIVEQRVEDLVRRVAALEEALLRSHPDVRP